MEAKELMIGDLVREGKDGRCLRVMQLEGILEDSIMTESGYDLIEHIEPIPLTQEILKANRFYKENESMVYHKDHLFVSCTIMEDVSVFSVEYSHYVGNTYCYEHVHRCAKYVHELQQALRVCGIYDMADNFILK